ncbi:hypothetical protein BESB_074830 [Besnoitia besnoiti]|uniref:Zinc finger, C3HC4 type (RING finger) domain-containing protein n=1 Tax=Besnoitia besnoiti TaxID=94643 RepID=A0A2A9MDH2_BESBE|nr:uncharacterized protein BESB_074830 [Besnoitia besnoiti]PFH34331.1 hypothetical protein BESB_074830 [Besnoitia besnoiti]
MKFGKSIQREAGKNCRVRYIDYKGLKKNIKRASSHLEKQDYRLCVEALQNFHVGLERELGEVRRTYTSQLQEVRKSKDVVCSLLSDLRASLPHRPLGEAASLPRDALRGLAGEETSADGGSASGDDGEEPFLRRLLSPELARKLEQVETIEAAIEIFRAHSPAFAAGAQEWGCAQTAPKESRNAGDIPEGEQPAGAPERVRRVRGDAHQSGGDAAAAAESDDEEGERAGEQREKEKTKRKKHEQREEELRWKLQGRRKREEQGGGSRSAKSEPRGRTETDREAGTPRRPAGRPLLRAQHSRESPENEEGEARPQVGREEDGESRVERAAEAGEDGEHDCGRKSSDGDDTEEESNDEKVFRLCIALQEGSTQARQLRRFVIWNSVAVVKIIKKKTKLLCRCPPPRMKRGRPAPSSLSPTSTELHRACTSPQSPPRADAHPCIGCCLHRLAQQNVAFQASSASAESATERLKERDGDREKKQVRRRQKKAPDAEAPAPDGTDSALGPLEPREDRPSVCVASGEEAEAAETDDEESGNMSYNASGGRASSLEGRPPKETQASSHPSLSAKRSSFAPGSEARAAGGEDEESANLTIMEACFSSASSVLRRECWYSSMALPSLLSTLDTLVDHVLLGLAGRAQNEDRHICPICLDVIVDPVILRACCHRFCFTCLAAAAISSPAKGELPKCPSCRTCIVPVDAEAAVGCARGVGPLGTGPQGPHPVERGLLLRPPGPGGGGSPAGLLAAGASPSGAVPPVAAGDPPGSPGSRASPAGSRPPGPGGSDGLRPEEGGLDAPLARASRGPDDGAAGPGRARERVHLQGSGTGSDGDRDPGEGGGDCSVSGSSGDLDSCLASSSPPSSTGSPSLSATARGTVGPQMGVGSSGSERRCRPRLPARPEVGRGGKAPKGEEESPLHSSVKASCAKASLVAFRSSAARPSLSSSSLETNGGERASGLQRSSSSGSSGGGSCEVQLSSPMEHSRERGAGMEVAGEEGEKGEEREDATGLENEPANQGGREWPQRVGAAGAGERGGQGQRRHTWGDLRKDGSAFREDACVASHPLGGPPCSYSFARPFCLSHASSSACFSAPGAESSSVAPSGLSAGLEASPAGSPGAGVREDGGGGRGFFSLSSPEKSVADAASAFSSFSFSATPASSANFGGPAPPGFPERLRTPPGLCRPLQVAGDERGENLDAAETGNPCSAASLLPSLSTCSESSLLAAPALAPSALPRPAPSHSSRAPVSSYAPQDVPFSASSPQSCSSVSASHSSSCPSFTASLRGGVPPPPRQRARPDCAAQEPSPPSPLPSLRFPQASLPSAAVDSPPRERSDGGDLFRPPAAASSSGVASWLLRHGTREDAGEGMASREGNREVSGGRRRAGALGGSAEEPGDWKGGGEGDDELADNILHFRDVRQALLQYRVKEALQELHERKQREDQFRLLTELLLSADSTCPPSSSLEEVLCQKVSPADGAAAFSSFAPEAPQPAPTALSFPSFPSSAAFAAGTRGGKTPGRAAAQGGCREATGACSRGVSFSREGDGEADGGATSLELQQEEHVYNQLLVLQLYLQQQRFLTEQRQASGLPSPSVSQPREFLPSASSLNGSSIASSFAAPCPPGFAAPGPQPPSGVFALIEELRAAVAAATGIGSAPSPPFASSASVPVQSVAALPPPPRAFSPHGGSGEKRACEGQLHEEKGPVLLPSQRPSPSFSSAESSGAERSEELRSCGASAPFYGGQEARGGSGGKGEGACEGRAAGQATGVLAAGFANHDLSGLNLDDSTLALALLLQELQRERDGRSVEEDGDVGEQPSEGGVSGRTEEARAVDNGATQRACRPPRAVELRASPRDASARAPPLDARPGVQHHGGLGPFPEEPSEPQQTALDGKTLQRAACAPADRSPCSTSAASGAAGSRSLPTAAGSWSGDPRHSGGRDEGRKGAADTHGGPASLGGVEAKRGPGGPLPAAAGEERDVRTPKEKGDKARVRLSPAERKFKHCPPPPSRPPPPPPLPPPPPAPSSFPFSSSCLSPPFSCASFVSSSSPSPGAPPPPGAVGSEAGEKVGCRPQTGASPAARPGQGLEAQRQVGPPQQRREKRSRKGGEKAACARSTSSSVSKVSGSVRQNSVDAGAEKLCSGDGSARREKEGDDGRNEQLALGFQPPPPVPPPPPPPPAFAPAASFPATSSSLAPAFSAPSAISQPPPPPPPLPPPPSPPPPPPYASTPGCPSPTAPSSASSSTRASFSSYSPVTEEESGGGHRFLASSSVPKQALMAGLLPPPAHGPSPLAVLSTLSKQRAAVLAAASGSSRARHNGGGTPPSSSVAEVSASCPPSPALLLCAGDFVGREDCGARGEQ